MSLKAAVNDPEGSTIRSALHALGFETVREVRTGKHITLTLDTTDRAQAQSMTEAMANQLLANSVIEDFRISLTPIEEPSSAVAGR